MSQASPTFIPGKTKSVKVLGFDKRDSAKHRVKGEAWFSEYYAYDSAGNKIVEAHYDKKGLLDFPWKDSNVYDELGVWLKCIAYRPDGEKTVYEYARKLGKKKYLKITRNYNNDIDSSHSTIEKYSRRFLRKGWKIKEYTLEGKRKRRRNFREEKIIYHGDSAVKSDISGNNIVSIKDAHGRKCKERIYSGSQLIRETDYYYDQYGHDTCKVINVYSSGKVVKEGVYSTGYSGILKRKCYFEGFDLKPKYAVFYSYFQHGDTASITYTDLQTKKFSYTEDFQYNAHRILTNLTRRNSKGKIDYEVNWVYNRAQQEIYSTRSSYDSTMKLISRDIQYSEYDRYGGKVKDENSRIIIYYIYTYYHPDTTNYEWDSLNFTNKADAKNQTLSGERFGKWVEYFNYSDRPVSADSSYTYYYLTYYKMGRTFGVPAGIRRKYFATGVLWSEENFGDRRKWIYKEYSLIDGYLYKLGTYNKKRHRYNVKTYYYNGRINFDEDYEYDFSYEDGWSKCYLDDGTLYWKMHYKDGRMDGKFVQYYFNGKVRSTENYKEGIQDGETKEYYEKGNLKRVAMYSNGKVVKEISYDEHGKQIKQ